MVPCDSAIQAPVSIDPWWRTVALFDMPAFGWSRLGLLSAEFVAVDESVQTDI